MDNACIHHGDEIVDLIEDAGMLSKLVLLLWLIIAGVHIEYLPPYSPDFNPIEEAFSKVKSFIRRYARLMAVDGDGIIFDMIIAMDVVTAEDAKGYFRHAGYF